jgi:hypothetical protein
LISSLRRATPVAQYNFFRGKDFTSRRWTQMSTGKKHNNTLFLQDILNICKTVEPSGNLPPKKLSFHGCGDSNFPWKLSWSIRASRE